MAEYTPETEVQYVKGVGPAVAKILDKLAIRTLGDLVFTLPRRYEDRTSFLRIRDVRPGQSVSLKGRIISLDSRNTRGSMTIIRAAISDGSGAIALIWFNQRWVKSKLEKVEGEIIVYGLVKEGQYGFEINSPEWEIVESDDKADKFAKITPVYQLSEGVNQKLVRRVIRNGLGYLSAFPDPLPESFLKKYKLSELQWALKNVHMPDSAESVQLARRRLIFEEFFYLQVALFMRKNSVGLESGIAFDIDGLKPVDEIEANLHFQLTGAQRRVLGEIFEDMKSPHPMNRLLQGDVGSGKTLVAAGAILAAVRNGYQAALMAPTEILAEQHFMNLKDLFEPFDVRVQLLVGKQTASEKKKVLSEISSKKADLIIGTHALIQEGVEFAKLGLIIVDEQHRFGVLQRAALRQKGITPDVLVMTATPIPRSLTLTLYGDLSLSVLDEMPPGRLPIKTHWKTPAERGSVYQGVRKLVSEGAQAYIVCPLVSESEKMLAQAAEELYERISSEILPGISVGLLHGRQKPKEKEKVMEEFRAGKIRVLVSTTVIEVGVDVPNATLMVIEDANRFGLSQLHQLRGRVGRGNRQSFCVLVGSGNNPEAEERLRVMVKTTDGFEIAEADLKIRGPGDMLGTRQSGALEFKVADLLRDGKLLEEARRAAIELLKADPQLSKPEHFEIAKKAKEGFSQLIKTDLT